MKIITRHKDLLTEFKRLVVQYTQFYWAGLNSDMVAEIKPEEQKIQKAIIGIQLYKTHPDIIKAFFENKNVRFKHQPEDMIQHRIYLFCNSLEDWEVIISCSNFTEGPCIPSNEALILISNQQMYMPDLYHKAMQLIEDHWKEAITFNLLKLEEYGKKWELQEQQAVIHKKEFFNN
ncbi:hypothetical protein BH23BAC1_BH23BAC1_08520 [soil metagenome]